MGGKKNKRIRRKQKQMKAEPERAEGPTILDVGSSDEAGQMGLAEATGPKEPAKAATGKGPSKAASQKGPSGATGQRGPSRAAGPSVLAGWGSAEATGTDAESGNTDDCIIPQGGAPSFDYIYGSTDESQNIIRETVQLLKSKDAEVNELSEMLNDAMHNWLKDMLKKVEIVKAEISATRDLVLPTCAVLDKLNSRQSEAGDIGRLVHSILDKVENMVKQLPSVTAVVGVVMEQIDLLQMEEDPIPYQSQFVEKLIESSSSAEPHTQENTPVASGSDPESDTLNELSTQECIVALPSDDDRIEETEARHEEGSDQDLGISAEMLTVMKAKDAEIAGSKDLLTNLMKYRVKDMMMKIDLATNDVEITRNLAIYSSDVIESLKRTPVAVDELNALVMLLFRKVDYIKHQISAANKIVDCTLEQISHIEGTEDFRNELFKSTIYDSVALLDSSNEAQTEANLETAINELHIQDPSSSPHERNASELNRSRSEDIADESYSVEEHMRGNSSVSSDGAEDDPYVLEVSSFYDLLSPKKRMKLEYPDCPDDTGAMSQASTSFFEVQECSQDVGKYFEVENIVLQLKSTDHGHGAVNLPNSEENEVEAEQMHATEVELKDFSKVHFAEYEPSSDEDSITEETDSEGVWLFRLDRQG